MPAVLQVVYAPEQHPLAIRGLVSKISHLVISNAIFCLLMGLLVPFEVSGRVSSHIYAILCTIHFKVELTQTIMNINIDWQKPIHLDRLRLIVCNLRVYKQTVRKSQAKTCTV